MTRTALAVAAALAFASPAFAQLPQPLPRLVFDAHGFMTSVADPLVTSDLNLTATDLPTKVRGFTVAGTFYVKRGPGVGIGFSAELLMGRGRHDTIDPTGATPDIKTATRLTAVSGNMSLNFGQRNGWSYITAGYGPVEFWTYLDDGTPHAPPKTNTLNAGGGARWFSSRHIAVSFDVRFYYTNPTNPIDDLPGRSRKKLTVLSVGISIR